MSKKLSKLKRELAAAKSKLASIKSNETHQNPNSQQNQNQSNGEEQHVPNRGIAVPNCPTAIDPSRPTNKKWTKAEKIDAVRFCMEAITLCIAGYLAWVYYAQMNAAVEQMNANKRQAVAAEKQLNEMREESVRGDRAWVMAYDFWKTNGVYMVSLKNTGRTPAINVNTDIRFTTKLVDVETAIWPTSVPGPFFGVLGPNSEVQAESSRKTYSNGGWFFGRIWYDDIFASNHWTDFCVWFRTDVTNDIDHTYFIRPYGNATEDTKTNKW
jgi:hypothetical protein